MALFLAAAAVFQRPGRHNIIDATTTRLDNIQTLIALSGWEQCLIAVCLLFLPLFGIVKNIRSIVWQNRFAGCEAAETNI